ncbi:hypothetical protein L596_009863 [Steinernema carpocapsae]|uniref:Uncharacterized protein n=1 Tax=Steinernema carpocapsae TaxID=34508 RepID=A0A4V6A6V1_STECR|nr:hypothetical protein L596_009863 [Steinernema carpocapsae]
MPKRVCLERENRPLSIRTPGLPPETEMASVWRCKLRLVCSSDVETSFWLEESVVLCETWPPTRQMC